MSFKNRFFSFLVALTLIFCSFTLSACAVSEKENAVDKFYSYNKGLLCISHRGDTANFPENSLEGVMSALEKGADFVSVNLEKTADGVFFLCEDESLGNVCNTDYESLEELKSQETEKFRLYDIFGHVTDCRLTSLETLIEKTDDEDGIILDVKPEDKDAVYDALDSFGALERFILRVKEGGRALSEWAHSKEKKIHVIGTYGGNIIFSTVSQINSLTEAEMAAVQYESKNYFNVAYGEFFTSRYLVDYKVRAIAATYSPDLCGQRSDGADGWNELIKKGYSVIETNNFESFAEYRNETERLRKSISDLVDKAFYADPANYSDVSLSNLKKAKLNAETLISCTVFSLDEAQQAYSQLNSALKQMKISTGEVDTRGALNVTAGKCIDAVLVGTALLAGQIYVYKMRKKSKEK